MSKLADVIRRSQRVESAPMGFGAARPAAKPSMLVGFAGAAAEAEAALANGAEIILIDGELSSAQIKEWRTKAGEKPLGVATKARSSAQVKELREAGLDFLIFDIDATAAAALLDEDLGYVLSIPASPDEAFLRSLDALSLEAVLLRPVMASFTAARQLELGRVAMLGHKPMICVVNGDSSSDDLQCLRAAGVVAVLASSSAGVEQLKGTVAALPVRKPKRDETRPVVSLPRGQAAQAADDDDDDDE
jgi:hypothetical protein